MAESRPSATSASTSPFEFYPEPHDQAGTKACSFVRQLVESALTNREIGDTGKTPIAQNDNLTEQKSNGHHDKCHGIFSDILRVSQTLSITYN
jgi:hypothetical protein